MCQHKFTFTSIRLAARLSPQSRKRHKLPKNEQVNFVNENFCNLPPLNYLAHPIKHPFLQFAKLYPDFSFFVCLKFVPFYNPHLYTLKYNCIVLCVFSQPQPSTQIKTNRKTIIVNNKIAQNCDQKNYVIVRIL